MIKTRSCNYSLDAPDDERYYSSKHVEQPSNKGIINYPAQLYLVGHFIRIVQSPAEITDDFAKQL